MISEKFEVQPTSLQNSLQASHVACFKFIFSCEFWFRGVYAFIDIVELEFTTNKYEL